MGTEQLYFIIGFLLGSILSGCIVGLCWIAYEEWIREPDQPEE
jgi:hypothetical protein